MTGSISGNSTRLLISLLILLGISGNNLFSQKNLSGNLNQPSTHVVSIPATDRVIVDDVTGFKEKDTVLLIQMQGVKIITPLTSADYGNLQQKFGEPGMHEFLIIQLVTVATKEIVFRNTLLNTYDPNGSIQIVRVPYYNSAVVKGTLKGDPWSTTTKTGGVVAMIIGSSLKLEADIDVSGMGFNGGKDNSGDAICINDNYALFTQNYFASSFTNAGFKGEGLAIHNEFGTLLDPDYMKGLGANFTGGGGGNGAFSGGGGGSNRGTGGKGGNENGFICPTALGGGGIGGFEAYHALLSDDRFYLGGGGGASTRTTGTLSNGGNGGGIVIIVADTIIGTGGNISSNGMHGGNSTGLAGSGGGGAGGSVVLSSNSISNISLSAKGGNGGNHVDGFSEGGGGGGGLIWINHATKPPTTTDALTEGAEGIDTVTFSSSTALPGTPGLYKYLFKANLNGFLFNSIRSSGSGDTLDYSCSNMLPLKLTGTLPVGGKTPYTYKWEKSYNLSSWRLLYNGPDSINYTPDSLEINTVYFRRTVTDSSTPDALVDFSKVVKIVVHPYIKNNNIGTSDTICFAQDPVAFTSKATLLDGNGIYNYKWEVSTITDSTKFSTPANINNAEAYTPLAALKVTSWYRRTVYSGACTDSSATAIAKITVLDTISNNKILISPPDICYGMTFIPNITATTSTTTPALAGGDNTYLYFWESSTNGTTWNIATGSGNGFNYDPDELSSSFPGSEYYRRVVKSGKHDKCVNTSNIVLLNDWPVITHYNLISADTTIGYDSVPNMLRAKMLLSGDGGNESYSYLWQNRKKAASWVTADPVFNGQNYSPASLTDTTWYRRIVNSSACSDTTLAIAVNVHDQIIKNNISFVSGALEDTICSGSVPGLFKGLVPEGGSRIQGINNPSDYAYKWYSSETGGSMQSEWSEIADSIRQDYQPAALARTTYFRRDVSSPAVSPTAVSKSNFIKVTVLPLITNSIAGSNTICYGTQPAVLQTDVLSGGDNKYLFVWQDSTDAAGWGNNTIGTAAAYQPPILTSPAKYKRIVYSGNNNCCIDTSNIISIGIDPLPAIPYAGPDTIISSIEKIFHMNADPLSEGETGSWTVVSGAGDFDDNSYNTVVRNLAAGGNTFLWTVSKGVIPCKLDTTVNITLLEDFIPQGFSPNGDAWNNTFIVEGLNKGDQIVELSVVNGAGTEVFSTSNRPGQTWTDWDGKNSSGLDLPEGTYYYLLKITSGSGDGQVFKKSGFIILKRY
jgi:predicted secreted protein